MKAVINATSSGQQRRTAKDFKVGEGVIAQSWDLFPGQKIKSLRLANNRKLIVGTETQLQIIHVDNCQEFTTCQKCAVIRDPHCAWSSTTQECVSVDTQSRIGDLIQSVNLGSESQCPPEETTNEVAIEANPLRSELEEGMRNI